MKGVYTAIEDNAIMRRLREVRTDISIASDVIVGFPGEDERDFDALMKLVDDIGYDNSYSFSFSARPGTPAATAARTPEVPSLRPLP